MNNTSEAHKKAVQKYFSGKTRYWNVLYNEDQSKERFMNYLMRRRKNFVLKLIDESIDKKKNINVLDVGCGTGVYINEFVGRGLNVYGLDISKEMVLKSLVTVNDTEKKLVKVAVGDAESLPFKKEFFDLIICCGVLEYLPSEISALTECKRLLKQNGMLIFTLPNLFKIQNFLDPYYYIKRPLRLLKKRFFTNQYDKVITPQDFSSNENFTNKRYRKNQIYTFLRSCDLHEKEILGIGYGAFSFWQKEILPIKWSIILSDFIEKIANYNIFKFLDKAASRWIICSQKKIV